MCFYMWPCVLPYMCGLSYAFEHRHRRWESGGTRQRNTLVVREHISLHITNVFSQVGERRHTATETLTYDHVCLQAPTVQMCSHY